MHWIAAAAGGLAILVMTAHRGALAFGRWIKQAPAFSTNRLCAAGTTAMFVIAATGYLLLGPATISAHGVVEYRPLVVVRATSAGFIRELYVADGDTVASGQRLALVENRELLIQLRMVQLDIEKSVARCRILRQAGETAKEQAEAAQQAALVRKRDELAAQKNDLIIVAPAGGQIVGRNLNAWLGRYVERGTELLQIGDESAKEVMLAIAQDDVELFQKPGDVALRVRMASPGTDVFEVLDLSIEPRGATQAPHEALSSRLGGPLPILVRDDRADPVHPPADELLDPCFKGTVMLSADQSRRLRAGQLATVEFESPAQSWAARALARIDRWFDHQLTQSESR
jgi:putative peptide zinc metalloprotease protein